MLDSIFFSERQFNKPVRLPCNTYVRATLTKKQVEVQQTERGSRDTSIECCPPAQETTCTRKPIVRPVVLKKQLYSHSPVNSTGTAPMLNRDTKKRNELFKIWNDNNDAQKTAARENRNSLFHSCMAFGPKQTENTEGMTPQETLESVKREFSKMVNITEDLLKKSNASKLQLETAQRSSLEGGKLGASGGPMKPKTMIGSLNNPAANNSLFGICGDYKILLSTSRVDCSKEEGRCGSFSHRSEPNTDNTITSAVKKIVGSNKPFLIPSREAVTRFPKQSTVKNFCQKSTAQNNLTAKENDSPKKVKSKFVHPATGLKEPQVLRGMTKADNYFMDSVLIEPIVPIAVKEQKGISPKGSDDVVKDNAEGKREEVKITEGSRSPHVPTENEVCNDQKRDPPENKFLEKEFNKYLHKKDSNFRIIDEELLKRNIVLVNNEKQHISKVGIESCNISSEQSIVEADKSHNNLRQQIIENMSRKIPRPVTIIPDESPHCSSPATATSISNGNLSRIKPDLYDKLDSTSATDSNNSFEVNERKSQVIQICDLTNSLEDLSRLDKICRIIEISDELSDKLFSSLDQEGLTGIQQKKWSFKDFCERIQLDDFCNKIFGKTRI